MMKSAVVRGRRTGKPETRAHILDVARRRFLRDGYTAVTLRSLAEDADVDVALISYYFGSKKGLFASALDLTANPAEILAHLLEGDVDKLAVRALRALLTVWDDPTLGAPLQTMIRSAAADPAMTELVRGGIQTEILERIAARIGGHHARHRAAAFGSQMVGVIFSRYIIAVEPIASMTVDEIVRALGPGLTVTLRGPRNLVRAPLVTRPATPRP